MVKVHNQGHSIISFVTQEFTLKKGNYTVSYIMERDAEQVSVMSGDILDDGAVKPSNLFMFYLAVNCILGKCTDCQDELAVLFFQSWEARLYLVLSRLHTVLASPSTGCTG